MKDISQERINQNEFIKRLVDRHQAGENMRYKLLEELQDITGAVIDKVCGQVQEIFLNQAGEWGTNIPKGAESEKMYMTLEAFTFDEGDLECAINKSINDALRTYKPDKNTKFSTWYYTTLESDLINLKNEYEQERDKGALINNMESFNQIIGDIGDVYNPEILENFKFIRAQELEEISDKQLKYITLNMVLYESNRRITDDVAAAALGVTRITIQRYKKELQQSLAGGNERRKSKKKPDSLPALINEFGAMDPTPREAASRIKYGPAIDENEFTIKAQNIKEVGTGTVGQIINIKADGEAWPNGYCLKCNLPLTTAGKCSNTNNCSG